MRKCPHCQATARQNKAGKTKAGSQRYRCMHCVQNYMPTPKHRGASVSIRWQVFEMPLDEGEVRPVPRQPQTAFREITLRSNKLGVPFAKNKAFQFASSANVGVKVQTTQRFALKLLIQQKRPDLHRIQLALREVRPWLNKVAVSALHEI